MNELARVDLNLLVTLHALLEERSVTRASARIGRSQPATSNALGRLRELLDDPLLVREGHEMVPTPRARALAGPLAEALETVRRAVAPPPPFDPATSERGFRIATDDLGIRSVIAPRLAAIRRAAPRVRLEVWPVAPDAPVDALASGDLDAAVGVYFDPPSTLGWEDVGRHGFAVIARADHPELAGGLDLDRYCSLDHVLVSARGATRSVVDFVLSNLGRTRRVAVTAPQFAAVPWLVAGTDLIATLPDVAVAGLAPELGLAAFPPPVELPTFPLRMLWHRRHEADSGLIWLRGQLARR